MFESHQELHLVHGEHRLQDINRSLLCSEVGKCVAILGGGRDQAGTVLQEELKQVGVIRWVSKVTWVGVIRWVRWTR